MHVDLPARRSGWALPTHRAGSVTRPRAVARAVAPRRPKARVHKAGRGAERARSW